MNMYVLKRAETKDYVHESFRQKILDIDFYQYKIKY